MLRRVTVATLLAISVVLLAGCGDDDNQPAIGTLAWGADSCLYAYVGGERWSTRNVCRRPHENVTVYETAEFPRRTLYRETAEHWYVDRDPTLELPIRISRRFRAREVFHRGQWIFETSYLVARADETRREELERQRQRSAQDSQAAQDRAEQQRRDQQRIQDEARSAAEAQRLELQQRMQEIQDRVMRRILAPDCASSYNGCP